MKAQSNPIEKIEDRRGGEILDLLAAGSPPAFAVNSEDRVIFWNRGAEDLFGRSAQETLGRACFDVVNGSDVFGNRFCYEECTVSAMTKRGEPIRTYEMVIRDRIGGQKSVSVTILRIPGSRRDLYTVVHLLQPIDEKSRLSRVLESLANSSKPLDPTAPVPIQPPPRPTPPLTLREKEILRWIAAGLQNKEIAQKLEISLATVRNHIRNILEKLEVHSKLEAVSLAFRNGWVTNEAKEITEE
jgi:PAS domain S-box-containing protein